MATEETGKLEDWSKRSNTLPERENKGGMGKCYKKGMRKETS